MARTATARQGATTRTTRIRTRTRDLNLQPVANDSKPTLEDCKAALTEFWRLYVASLAAGRALREKKADLQRLMEESGNRLLTDRIDLGHRLATVEASISPGEKKSINIEKLKELVSEEDFLKIVSATQTTVKSVAGGNVLLAVLETEATPPDLSVRELK